MLSRRALLRGLSAAPLAPLAAGCAPEAPASARFAHGVAAGDPGPGSLVLWTRLSGVTQATAVHWQIARDAALVEVVAAGLAEAAPERDFTVKVEASGLPAGAALHYRFDVVTPAGLLTSPLGRARTLPEATERVRLGVCACASYAHGFFHGYRLLAERDLDLVLHLGDFLYEYGSGEYGALRPYEPPRECRTLADYRARYAQYRRDPDLAALSAAHAMSALWDDHEFANNAHPEGSDWHDAGAKGAPWSERREAARRAFFEWMPLREGPSITRTLRFGALAELLLLDTRMEGRDPPVWDEASRADPARRLLSGTQEAWLLGRLGARDVTYRLLATQVLLAHHPELSNWDSWEGFPAQRDRVLEAIAASGPTVLALAGDSHASWATELARDPFSPAYDPATGAGAIGVELGVPGISSPNLDPAAAPAEAARILAASPHTRYTEQSSRGFLVLDLDAERARAERVFVDGVTDPGGGTAREGPVHEVRAGAPRLVR